MLYQYNNDNRSEHNAPCKLFVNINEQLVRAGINFNSKILFELKATVLTQIKMFVHGPTLHSTADLVGRVVI